MVILELVLFTAAFAAVALLALNQSMTLVREYRFYKGNGWDFSADSGLDRIDERIAPYPLPLTNWQRLFLFRPLYISMLLVFIGAMIWSML